LKPAFVWNPDRRFFEARVGPPLTPLLENRVHRQDEENAACDAISDGLAATAVLCLISPSRQESRVECDEDDDSNNGDKGGYEYRSAARRA
jgi:hypothetical protein